MGVTMIKDNAIDFKKYANTPLDAAYVRPASNWRDEVKDQLRNGFKPTGLKLPWLKTHDAVRLRPGEVSVFAGYSGHGKSLLHGQVQLALIAQQQKVCVASLEMPPIATLRRMARQAMGSGFPTNVRIDAFFESMDGLLYVYDQQDTVPWKRMVALARYCAAELGIQHMVIDSLMKCGIGVDDYTTQKIFVDQLCAVAKDTGLHVHLIAHGRKGATEAAQMDKFDIKGASEITDQADNVFTLWRNKKKEEALQSGKADNPAEPDAILNVVKQRHGEYEGKFKLWFNPPTQQYMEASRMAPVDFDELKGVVNR